jgi:hypothetical protein
MKRGRNLGVWACGRVGVWANRRTEAGRGGTHGRTPTLPHSHTPTLPLLLLLLCALTLTAHAQQLFPGDGSGETGFVPPPAQPQLPPAPPRTVSSAETLIPFPPPPAMPQARTEAKKPPKPPVLFTKLKTEHLQDWSATPNDVNNLLKQMKGMMDVSFSMEVKPLIEVDTDPEKNPILYRSGHYHFTFTPEERAKLRKFMLDGGMLVLNTGLSSRPFYDSAKQELALIFPEVHLQRLSSDHPIFHSYFDLDTTRYRPGVRKTGFTGNEPWFDGITVDCRTVAVISRWCMAVGWEGNENDDYQAYVSEDAQKLGINLFAYATAQRAWARKRPDVTKLVNADDHSMDKVALAQVVYDGEWKTRHAGLSVLLHAFNLKTDVPVKFGLKEIRLSNPAVFDAPLLYMTGHESFRLRPEEQANLRQYLLSGGFLFAEACCGRKGFDLAFRQHVASLFPDKPLQPIPAGNLVFSLPNTLAKVGVTPALAAQLGAPAAAPRLLGIEINGHYAVIYSPFGMAGGWEMAQNPYALGYDESGAMLLGQNVLMYAVSQ